MSHYRTLGVTPSATSAEIRKAFFSKAREVHPDKNTSPDATAKFQQINAAYEVLGSPEKRKAYDSASTARHSAVPRPQSPRGRQSRRQETPPRSPKADDNVRATVNDGLNFFRDCNHLKHADSWRGATLPEAFMGGATIGLRVYQKVVAPNAAMASLLVSRRFSKAMRDFVQKYSQSPNRDIRSEAMKVCKTYSDAHGVDFWKKYTR